MNARKTEDECEMAYQDEIIERIWSMVTEDEYEKTVQYDRVMQSTWLQKTLLWKD